VSSSAGSTPRSSLSGPVIPRTTKAAEKQRQQPVKLLDVQKGICLFPFNLIELEDWKGSRAVHLENCADSEMVFRPKIPLSASGSEVKGIVEAALKMRAIDLKDVEKLPEFQ